MRIYWKFIWIIIVIGVLMLLARVILFPLFAINRGVSATEGMVNQTVNSTNILYNYNWFYQQYNDANSLAQKYWQAKQTYDNDISMFPKNMTTWTMDEQQTAQQDETVYQGLLQQLDDCVNTYNAHYEEADRGIFKGKNLPTQLNVQEILSSQQIPGVN